jgi:hypothetical protein
MNYQMFQEKYPAAVATLTPEKLAELQAKPKAWWGKHRKKLGMTLIKWFVDEDQIAANLKARRHRAALRHRD